MSCLGRPLVADGATVSDPAGALAVLLTILAAIFWLERSPVFSRVFKFVPSLVFCYFVPTTLTTLGILPASSPLYSWVKTHALPAALLLVILALDLPAIRRLGPKAVLVFLAGTLGVMVGGPLSYWLCKDLLPEDAWRGVAALCGSWIGGGANFVAVGQAARASDTLMGTMVIPDVFVANIWMGVLLYAAGQQLRIDRLTGADASAIRELERRMADFQASVNRIPSLGDLLLVLALAFGGGWICDLLAGRLPPVGQFIDAFTWKFILVTTVGVLLSLTPARRLEGAGASRIGSLLIYVLVACIGASADFSHIREQPYFILMAAIWMCVHVVFILAAGWLLRAPVFFMAVGSQANIGGAASAPVVAAAFHPALAPVGALLAVFGYVLGTYCGIVCLRIVMWIAGANEL